jgi:dipeptidyl-peptidase 4
VAGRVPSQGPGRIDDVWGVLYRPSNFDPDHTYPVIDDIYPGPQTIRSAIRFPRDVRDAYGYWAPQVLAEIGFVVVTVEGMGTPLRSKAFHDVGYRNLGDGGGIPDHVAALRELAATRPYLDLERVGITGGSSGGYASTRAMLTHPHFFKVAVSWVPYPGPSLIVPWWSERYQGYPVDEDNYRANDNMSLAGNLKGKLLMVLGELDEHANPLLMHPFM